MASPFLLSKINSTALLRALPYEFCAYTEKRKDFIRERNLLCSRPSIYQRDEKKVSLVVKKR